MRFVADLHIHSHLSRATSKNLNLEQLHRWAQLKGIGVVGTGDFTHPRWFAELREKLVPEGDGLFALRDDLARPIDAEVPPACRAEVRFLLSVEISNIYKRAERVRKVHNLVYAPDFDTAGRIAGALARIGNLSSDGRPILGLDSRDLLEIVLESSSDAFLVPAHIWTPWFSALGAQSGFDAIADCYDDLAAHVFAAETGLSSDPAMNWRLTQLDRLALVSNSDAHSPEKLGREANLFDCERSYFTVRDALRGRAAGFLGTVEFFPEEGKYHFDGHRKCRTSLDPRGARETGGLCPACGKKLTAGVMSRIEALADRPEGDRPESGRPYRSLVPLAELIGEVIDTGAKSLKVRRAYDRLLERVGPELSLLVEAPIEELDREGPPLLAEAVRRMRAGEVKVTAGYDGEYGVIRAFDEAERRRLLAQLSFALPGAEAVRLADAPAPYLAASTPAAPKRPGPAVDAGLNPQQRAVVEHGDGPILVVAGPGTGKTRTIVHRIAHLVRTRGVSPPAITAITFTRKAAGELRERLLAALGPDAEPIAATTFHAFGLELLRAFRTAAGLPPEFRVLDESERRALLESAVAGDRAAGKAIARAKAHGRSPGGVEAALRLAFAAYEDALARAAALDFDDLVARAVALLESSAEALVRAQERCRYLFVDEYQDVNAAQHRLVRLLAPPGANLCAVGDPDQAIYGFRGADASYLKHFAADYPDAAVVALAQNYRSPAAVVRAATQVIAGSPGRKPRSLHPLEETSPPIEIVAAANEADEAAFVAAEIERALGGTSLYSLDAGRADGGDDRALAFHDFAVLFRIGAQADALAEALGRAGIPFRRAGDAPLTADPLVAELCERLRRLSGSKDARPAASDRALTAQVGRRPVAEIVDALFQSGRGGDDRRRAADLVAAIAVPFGIDVAGFADHLATFRETDLGLETQKVALLSLHAAKGLEFPVVFVTGCEDGLIPFRQQGLAGIDVEEERRLLYVGMTRARRRLVITAAARRTLFGRTREAVPSPFLATFAETPITPVRIGLRPDRVRQLRLL